MALQATITFENGITLQEAYIVIKDIVMIYSQPNIATITVLIYKDQTAFNDEKSEVISLVHKSTNVSFNTYFSEDVLNEAFKNPLSQGYLFLQSLDFYGGAIIV